MFSSQLQFTLHKQSGNARAGTIYLHGIQVQTPVFMPVGTKASIKGLFLDMLRNPEYLGELDPIQLMLSNTFHLHLRPGEQLVHEAGGVQKFMNRPGLVLTDSGGFQVFSLGLQKKLTGGMNKKGPIISLKEEGIKFQSPIDGSRHFMSPEDCIDIQAQLGSDIMMVLDVCSPGASDDRIYKRHMDMTHRWADRQFQHMMKYREEIPGVLFPIVQGGTNYNFRAESMEYLSQYAIDGIAVGGVSVGESRQQVQDITSFCGSRLPHHVPRYLMGIGDPDTIRHAIYSGFDMFDCVMPTRLGRHGIAYSDQGNIHIKNACYRNDHSFLWPEAKNKLSRTYTKAYVHHLLRENEMLGGMILSLHNIFYLHQMVQEIRDDILGS